MVAWQFLVGPRHKPSCMAIYTAGIAPRTFWIGQRGHRTYITEGEAQRRLRQGWHIVETGHPGRESVPHPPRHLRRKKDWID